MQKEKPKMRKKRNHQRERPRISSTQRDLKMLPLRSLASYPQGRMAVYEE